jgi:hypothetical protein
LDTYKVVRHWRNGRRKIIMKGASLEVAQLHCRSEFTHKKDSQGNIIWFDGYDKD